MSLVLAVLETCLTGLLLNWHATFAVEISALAIHCWRKSLSYKAPTHISKARSIAASPSQAPLPPVPERLLMSYCPAQAHLRLRLRLLPVPFQLDRCETPHLRLVAHGCFEGASKNTLAKQKQQQSKLSCQTKCEALISSHAAEFK